MTLSEKDENVKFVRFVYNDIRAEHKGMQKPDNCFAAHWFAVSL